MNRTVFVLIPIAAFLAFLFFLGGPDYYSPRSYKHFWDQGHIIFFAIFAYLTLSLWKKLSNQPFWRQCTCIFGMTLILGLIVEIGQSGIDRSPDAGDLIRNLIGASLVLCFWSQQRKTVRKLRLRILQIATVTATVIGFLPLAVALTDEWIAKNQFPVLADFETPFEIYRWVGGTGLDIDNSISFHGRSSLKIQLSTSKYSGVALKYFPADWKGYSALKFSVYNPASTPIQLTCRIHDLLHIRGPELYEDRFNRSYIMTSGWNPVTINIEEISSAPKNRRMNISQIKGIGLFTTQLRRPRFIYLDYIRLSN